MALARYREKENGRLSKVHVALLSFDKVAFKFVSCLDRLGDDIGCTEMALCAQVEIMIVVFSLSEVGLVLGNPSQNLFGERVCREAVRQPIPDFGIGALSVDNATNLSRVLCEEECARRLEHERHLV